MSARSPSISAPAHVPERAAVCTWWYASDPCRRDRNMRISRHPLPPIEEPPHEIPLRGADTDRVRHSPARRRRTGNPGPRRAGDRTVRARRGARCRHRERAGPPLPARHDRDRQRRHPPQRHRRIHRIGRLHQGQAAGRRLHRGRADLHQLHLPGEQPHRRLAGRAGRPDHHVRRPPGQRGRRAGHQRQRWRTPSSWRSRTPP
jgi:hypothetical protein